MSNKGFLVFACAVGGVVWLLNGGGANNPSSSSSTAGRVQLASTSSTSPSAAKLNELRPANQRTLLSAVEDGRAAYGAGANDMAKGAARPARAKDICKALSSMEARTWIGQVSQLSSNSDGKGVLAVKFGPDVYAKTWNNDFSDTGDRTLIDPSSSLFTKASSLTKGQWVVFSGTFFRANSDCIKESSMTMQGAMTEPEFVFRFTDISPLQL